MVSYICSCCEKIIKDEDTILDYNEIGKSNQWSDRTSQIITPYCRLCWDDLYKDVSEDRELALKALKEKKLFNRKRKK